ncbi:MAG: hypothetical protein ACLR77_13525 [Oscillospiraceae bacterium]
MERSHRKDNEYFYASHKFYSFEDFARQLAVWQRQYNNFPMRPLNWISPKTALFSFLMCNTSLTNLHLVFFTAACYTQGVLFRSRKERQIAVL